MPSWRSALPPSRRSGGGNGSCVSRWSAANGSATRWPPATCRRPWRRRGHHPPWLRPNALQRVRLPPLPRSRPPQQLPRCGRKAARPRLTARLATIVRGGVSPSAGCRWTPARPSHRRQPRTTTTARPAQLDSWGCWGRPTNRTLTTRRMVPFTARRRRRAVQAAGMQWRSPLRTTKRTGRVWVAVVVVVVVVVWVADLGRMRRGHGRGTVAVRVWHANGGSRSGVGRGARGVEAPAHARRCCARPLGRRHTCCSTSR